MYRWTFSRHLLLEMFTSSGLGASQEELGFIALLYFAYLLISTVLRVLCVYCTLYKRNSLN